MNAPCAVLVTLYISLFTLAALSPYALGCNVNNLQQTFLFCFVSIWWSVIADIVINLSLLVGVFVLGLTISLGLAVTCSQVNIHYGSSGFSK